MKTQVVRYGIPILPAVLLGALSSWAASPVLVATGYYDEPPDQGYGGSNLPLPSPWYGSPNTTYFGSVADATSSDPDLSAVLFQNLGTSTATLTAASLGGSYDLFSYNSITGPILLPPGQFIILAGPDGSDVSFPNAVNVTVNGTAYSYPDAVDPTFYPSGVLHGFPESSDETVPWTTIYTPTTLPPPQLTLQNPATNNWILTWNSAFGQAYQIQSTTNLSPANWVDLGAIQTATNATVSFSDPSGGPLKFYRVAWLNH